MTRRKLKNASRVIARLELTPQAKDRVNRIAEERGMTQTAMLSRLVEWFAGQTPMVQGLVLGHLPDDVQAKMTKLLMEQIAKQMKSHAE